MSWKSFKFFDLEEVKDPDTNQAYDKLKVGDKSNVADGNTSTALINAHHLNLDFDLIFSSGPEGDLLRVW